MSLFSNILNIIIFIVIVTYIILYFTGKAKLIVFHPLIAIFIGVVITILMYTFFSPFVQNIPLSDYIQSHYLLKVSIVSLGIPIAVFIGGLVATLISQVNKASIGIFVGIFFALIISYLSIALFFYYNISYISIIFIFCLISAGIGGYTAKKLREYVIKKQVLNSKL
jgi:hypothetical protein